MRRDQGRLAIETVAFEASPRPTIGVEWEFALVERALARQLPVLGICRGAQVLNVVLGGTLHQHLPDVLGHSRHQLGNAVFTTSAVVTVPGTRLAALIGESTDAQCYHHQGIDRLGRGLIVSALDGADRTIEAVELDPGAHPDQFAIAVQWHPEERLDDLRLFAAVVAADVRPSGLRQGSLGLRLCAE